MKQNPFKAALIVFFAVFLAACTTKPQPSIYLDADLFFSKKQKLGFVYIGPENHATTHILGADCLACFAVASALTNELDAYLETYISNDELLPIADYAFAEYISRSPGTERVSLPAGGVPDFDGEHGFAKKDFRVLKEEFEIDVLAVLEIHAHGAVRTFNGYLPVNAPKGYIEGAMYLVDLQDNKLIQYKKLKSRVHTRKQWDEPPEFPSVTAAYYQAIENIKQSVKNAL